MKALRHILFPNPHSLIRLPISYSLILLLFLASCTKQEATLSVEEVARADSLALQVAVIPTLGCLPTYYAARCGVFDEEGVHVKLLPYTAQMDIDTALINRHAHVACTDLIRALRLSGQKTLVRAFLANDETMSLVAVKGRRVNKVLQLKERMIAISRLCISDYWCEQFIDSNDVARPDFYRPQIHDVRLRADMLRTGLMDAAILPEPYTAWMQAVGNVRLAESTAKGPSFAAWVFADSLRTDTFRMNQIARFALAYDKAADMINEGEHKDIIRAILTHEYGIAPEALDSLSLPHMSPARKPKQEDVEAAAKWLKGKQRLPREARPDSLIYELRTDSLR
ncbi:MAG: ABC transporter substrate-binding protein [Bacteroidaceae bacterium]|nr:ABC transporter substrate-binding protein [Bacteroidaceae bacterium]